MKSVFCFSLLGYFLGWCNGDNSIMETNLNYPVNTVLEGPLFLTPYLNSEQIEVARELAKVKGLDPLLHSYSGFITVNETTNANIFFLFIPAAVSLFTKL